MGSQIVLGRSEEGPCDCLGLVPGQCRRLPGGVGLKVPHMGWNALEKVNGWLDPSLEGDFVYFVHSFYVPLTPQTAAETNYGIRFSAALKKDNFYAAQFHPEKSAEAGVKVLQSFLDQPA